MLILNLLLSLCNRMLDKCNCEVKHSNNSYFLYQQKIGWRLLFFYSIWKRDRTVMIKLKFITAEIVSEQKKFQCWQWSGFLPYQLESFPSRKFFSMKASGFVTLNTQKVIRISISRSKMWTVVQVEFNLKLLSLCCIFFLEQNINTFKSATGCLIA